MYTYIFVLIPLCAYMLMKLSESVKGRPVGCCFRRKEAGLENIKNNGEYEDQVESLLQELTLEEKLSMIHGCGIFRTAAVERLGIPSLVTSDGPMGVRQEFPDDSLAPVGRSDDYVTYNPSNSALAATWNPERAYRSGQVLGEEARGRGKDVILAPGINIKRDPLCGRNFEYMAEDPYLIGTMAVPFIQGVQESDVAACVKHFAANSQETDRFWVDTVVEERALREIYLPGFQAAVQEAGAFSLMNAYNKLNGTHCSESRDLLDELLRKEWGYDGTVISDWDSVHTTAGAANAAIDLEMGVNTDFDHYYFARPLGEAVRKGEVPEAAVDGKVRNILRMMYRLKMLGPHALERRAGAYNTPEHRQTARETAQEAVILLKNEGGVLPITPQRLAMEHNAQISAPRKRRIAVIGRNGEQNHAAGGGSAEVKALYEVSPLLGLKKALGGNVDVVYAPGYDIPGEKDVNTTDWEKPSLERRVMGGEEPADTGDAKLREEILRNRELLKQEACELAKTADEVIFIGGLNHDYDTEGRDRRNMELPYGQDELVEALLEIHPETIVVMVAGSAVEMPWAERAKALVWCYYAGMETGTALADILLGRVNPSAKLPETFPISYRDTPTCKNGEFGKAGRVEYKEGIFVGYRYYEQERIKPLFAFGHGLSYTDFSLEDLRVWKNDKEDDSVTVSLKVSNTGGSAGAEVVQCYVGDPLCSVPRPPKELKAYQKVFLQPGEQKEVTFILPGRAFAFYSVEEKDFIVEPGIFRIYVGNASDNCPLAAEIRL